eukprot:CAMPEP_0183360580 /NCGR_PEP_ID=MMETSP0164_2-20130417/55625_1 /TAXON_ID=221442 /ORGANISM="Coccolithus pelagicus ssp braarudi, Strain PLY182g" /LENGTH=295 /DNA_ID=CAMNT_0025534977 /DNA_START=104 /DNA_END=991 /DNA_ORIENTATION=+
MTRVAPICMLGSALLAHFASTELCNGLNDEIGSGGQLSDGVLLDRGLDGTSTPFAIFCALFVQGIVQAASARDGAVLEVHAAMTVWGLTALFYLQRWLGSACTLPVRWVSGSGLCPLHYALWAASMSGQVVTLFTLERTLAERGRRRKVGEHPGSCCARTPHRRCCLALLSVQGMLWSGGLADTMRHATWSLAWALLAASFACFYMLLATGIVSPLSDAQAHPIPHDDAARKNLAKHRLRGMQLYLLVAWHAFPVVWSVDQLGWLDHGATRTAYFISDVIAKLLPISIYLTVAST